MSCNNVQICSYWNVVTYFEFIFKGEDIDLAKGVKTTKGLGFGDNMKALESIVERLESDDLPLEEALAAFEEGVKLSKELRATLEAAQKKVEILLKDSKGNPVVEPFDPGLSDAPKSGEKDKEG